jgi:hypothetical protein
MRTALFGPNRVGADTRVWKIGAKSWLGSAFREATERPNLTLTLGGLGPIIGVFRQLSRFAADLLVWESGGSRQMVDVLSKSAPITGFAGQAEKARDGAPKAG